MTIKKCPSCGQRKRADEFGRNRALKDGLSCYCLACNRARNNAWYRERRRAQGKQVRDHSWIPAGFRWGPSCERPVPHQDYTRNRRTASGFGSRCRACANAASSAGYFYRAYKLTPRAIDSLRSGQGNACGICREPDPQHLDRDHATGKIRMLLCQRCNHGLGLFRDDPYLLHVAALYVEGNRQQHAFDQLEEAAADAHDADSRPREPPVGSQRRPGTHATSARSIGRKSRSRRRTQAGEADG